MTEKNYEFLTETFEKLKMKDTFNEVLRKGMENGLPDISFGRAEMPYDNAAKESLAITPKVIDQGKGFYVMKGYMATLSAEGKEPLSQFMDVFKKSGFNIDQAAELLRGGAVLNYVTKDDVTRGRYTQLDFQQTTDSGNFRMKHTNENEFNISRILSKIPFEASEQDKKFMIKDLQNGKQIYANVRKEGRPERMMVMLNPSKGVINVTDKLGTVKSYVDGVKPELRLVAGPSLNDNKGEDKTPPTLSKAALALLAKKDAAKKKTGQSRKVS
jgi:hypothetical protein